MKRLPVAFLVSLASSLACAGELDAFEPLGSDKERVIAPGEQPEVLLQMTVFRLNPGEWEDAEALLERATRLRRGAANSSKSVHVRRRIAQTEDGTVRIECDSGTADAFVRMLGGIGAIDAVLARPQIRTVVGREAHAAFRHEFAPATRADTIGGRRRETVFIKETIRVLPQVIDEERVELSVRVESTLKSSAEEQKPAWRRRFETVATLGRGEVVIVTDAADSKSGGESPLLVLVKPTIHPRQVAGEMPAAHSLSRPVAVKTSRSRPDQDPSTEDDHSAASRWRLTDQHGPIMILAQRIQIEPRLNGQAADESMADLVGELRKQGLPAYVHTDRRSGHDEVRLYVGNYKSPDEEVARKTLEFLRKYSRSAGAAPEFPFFNAHFEINPLSLAEESASDAGGLQPDHRRDLHQAVKELRSEVQALRKDVERVLELLERRAEHGAERRGQNDDTDATEQRLNAYGHHPGYRMDRVSLDFDEAPLRGVIRELATKADVNIVLDRAGLEEEGVTLNAPVTIHVHGVSLRSALQLILAPLQLAYTATDNVLTVTSRSRSHGRPVVRTYPIADILPAFENESDLDASFDALIGFVVSTVAPESWAERGGQGMVRQYRTTLSLVVRQTESVHQELADLLAQVRRLQQHRVSLDVRAISVPEKHEGDLRKVIDLDRGGRTVLEPSEAAELLDWAQGHPRVNLWQADRLILENGRSKQLTAPLRRPEPDVPVQVQAVISAEGQGIRLETRIGPDGRRMCVDSRAVPDAGTLVIDAAGAAGERQLLLIAPTVASRPGNGLFGRPAESR